MWKRHWGLSRDPFLDGKASFIALPAHQEAASRLVYTIETAQRIAVLRADAGLGKTTVLRQALADGRRAGRRIVLTSHPIDAGGLWNDLADQLGAPAAGSRDDRAAGWRRLERAVKVASLEGRRVVLAVDGAEALWDDSNRPDLLRLASFDGGDGTTTVLLAVRESGEFAPALPWTLTIGLVPLTRSEVEHYLAAKLAASGCSEPLFTPQAIVRLHALSSGVPRGLDRLASLALMAAASRGLEAVSSEVVDGAARECSVPWS
jgi:MSHA biogenesis protein MshM